MMDVAQYISSQLAGKILGVSVSTVKRWVDDKILPADKTPGGHRKILVADLIRLSRQGVLPVGDFSKLPLIETQPNNSNALQISADNFYQALRNQSLLSCNNIILSAYKNNMPIEKITDEIIQPSMARIGEEWMSGNLPIFYEHCSTQLCISTLFELRNFINSRDNTNGPIAIGGCASNEHHQLCNMLVEVLLFDLGWNTKNIGANTPIESFIDGINHYKPRLVWMSTTNISNVDGFVKDNLLLFDKVCDANSVLVVGGQGLTPAIRKKIKFHFYGDTMCHLADYARGLFPPAVLPQRGRPPLPV
ncbi:MAG: helix-turn-helix domain-containing protein [Planctomycetota bacterium]|nr:helix-turn-helix domain-containing protein [Planctomycetota bacterium]